MKHTVYTNRSIRYGGSILLILAFALASLGASLPTRIEQQSASQIAISNYLAAQQDPELSDEEKIKAAIDAYFTLRYEGLKLLKAQDFSALVEDKTLNWVRKEKDKQEIEIYVATLYDSPYIEYRYTIDYDSIAIDENKAVVQLRESNEVVTKIDLATSYMGNLPHTFVLHNKNKKGWVIYKDEYQDEISQGLAHQTKEELLFKVKENYEKSKQQSSTPINGEIASASAQPLHLPLILITGY